MRTDDQPSPNEAAHEECYRHPTKGIVMGYVSSLADGCVGRCCECDQSTGVLPDKDAVQAALDEHHEFVHERGPRPSS